MAEKHKKVLRHQSLDDHALDKIRHVFGKSVDDCLSSPQRLDDHALARISE